MTLDWSKAKIRETLSVSYENEKLMNDAASRWLSINDQKIIKKKKPKFAKKKKPVNQKFNLRNNGIVIYTDGACEPNPGIGGWGYVVYSDGKEIHTDFGGSKISTNNIMEMTAIIRALEWLRKSDHTDTPIIYSDSQYAVKGCTLWRHNWKRKGWKKASGGEVANVELWKELSEILDNQRVKIEWCKGHVGIEGNERADDLSVKGRLSAVD